jgi:uncharacterized protein YjbI with pentapeptide repeats
MLQLRRRTSIIGAPLILAAMLACVTPAGAKISVNGTSLNGTSLNGTSLNGTSLNGTSLNGTSLSRISANAHVTTGSALSDLNGVAVESVVIPEAASR